MGDATADPGSSNAFASTADRRSANPTVPFDVRKRPLSLSKRTLIGSSAGDGRRPIFEHAQSKTVKRLTWPAIGLAIF
jgi:hypothetical protein